ncbi:MAG: LysR family transcriptional regulator [Bacteroidetes bacterium]|nr:LysR family transcriptional regulator [Bacteroidota bacterium]
MNLQQLEYVIAVDKYRHFAKAAEHCYVTQPTLSMMIQKLEEELELKIFDRNKKPVQPTKEGAEVIERAKELLLKAESLKEYAMHLKVETAGELHLGVIPTIAPYLLPMFLMKFTEAYPDLKVYIKEMLTGDIISKLKSGELDVGLLATPLSDHTLEERVLYYEEFYAYGSTGKQKKNKLLLPKEIDLNQLWLLEEGHCMRNQVFNLCELKKKDIHSDKLHYEAGSIETLINLVDNSHGITIVPYLATLLLKPAQQQQLQQFADPKPVREVSLVTMKNFPRKKLLDNLYASITGIVPPFMKASGKKQVASIDDILD